MKYRFMTLALIGAMGAGGANVLAQRWGRPSTPSRGACFYEDINYGGRYFCYAIGADARQVPPGTNDEISSIRVFGRTEVTVYRDQNFRGASRRLTSSIDDLRDGGWNDRISSFRIKERQSGGDWGGGGAYGGGNWGGSNASGQGGGYGGGWGGAYGAGSHGGWGNADGGSRWTYQQAEEIVRRAYRSTLGRDPDAAARPWVNEVMKNNLSQAQLEAELRKSDEYRNRQR